MQQFPQERCFKQRKPVPGTRDLRDEGFQVGVPSLPGVDLRIVLVAVLVAATSTTGLTTAAAQARCPAPTITAATVAELGAALVRARPGDVIQIADGTYDGNWTARTPGTPAAPIWLCGGPRAVLTNSGHGVGYGLHLDGASWWHVAGFTVTRARKGVVVDAAQHVTLDQLTIYDTDHEGIHLRTNTTDSLITGNQVHGTGRTEERWGEGLYIGSAVENWPAYTAGLPDRSDRNTVISNTIYDTTAEPVDIKEGTTGGLVTENDLNAAGLAAAGGDSCGDVKGNDWRIDHNRCVGSATDGWQTHRKHGFGEWGLRAGFTRNIVMLDGTPTGYGFKIDDPPYACATVHCDNSVVGTFANVPCTGNRPPGPRRAAYG